MPAILGLPALGTLLVSAFSGLFAFFFRIFTLRLTLAVLVIALFSSLLSAFLSSALGQLDSVLAMLSPLDGLGYFLPSNTAFLVSTMITTEVFCAVYSLAARILFRKAQMVAP